MPLESFRKIYRPSALVGPVYARPYGSTALPMPVGNVLELTLDHTEDVQTQDDMSVAGGGLHAEMRRVTAVKTTMKIADWNVVNMARASYGTTADIEGGTVTNEPFTAVRGGLMPLEHIAASGVVVRKGGGVPTPVVDEQHADVDKGDLVMLAHANPTAVTVKVGATSGAATEVAMAGNYEVGAAGIQVAADAPDIADGSTLWVSYTYETEGVIIPAAGNYIVRGEGILLNTNAAAIEDGDQLRVSYSYGDYAVIEALTTKPPELELVFGGMNEAASGLPHVVNIWRCSQGIAKQLALISKSFGAIDVEGSVMQDPNKEGEGISKYYRSRLKL